MSRRDDRGEGQGSRPLPDDDTRTELVSARSTGSAGAPRGPSLEQGQIFGGYRLGRVLGEGGFGQVWEATSEETGRRVALKVLTGARALPPDAIERFRREGQLAAALNDPHCVYVFGAEQIEGYPAIVMELMPGGTLQDRLKRSGPLHHTEAVDLVLDLADGLEAARRAGILHRDVKPSNCFLDASGTARIGDFGLSKTLDVDSSLTVTGQFMGTPYYASPEQIRGRDVDSRGDIYSLGATLYAMLTNRPPFEGGQAGEVLARILSESPTELARHGVEIPRGLERVLARMMAKDREARYSGYAEVRDALMPFSSRGLDAGGLARRFGALLVDVVSLLLLVSPMTAYVLFGRPGPDIHTALTLVGLAAYFLYFWIGDGLWGGTPGKKVFRLRVTTVEGSTRDLGRVALRTGVFLSLFAVPGAAIGVWSVRAGPESVWPWYAIQSVTTLLQLLLASTMRRANGYAGIHELASGTRVRSVARREALGVPVQPLPATSLESAVRFGPYVATARLWREDGAALLLCRDETLDRDVWVHTYDDAGRAPSLEQLAAIGGSRVRWLQGGRDDRGGWDAYQVPQGTALPHWVALAGTLPWRAVRGILRDLSAELDRARGQGWTGRRLSPAHVWVDVDGRTHLLDFPAPGPRSEDAVPVESWARFLHRILLHALEGAVAAGPPLDDRLPSVPLPAHARPVVERVCRLRPVTGPAELARELDGLAGRPTEVTPGRRLSATAIVAAVPVLAVLLIGMNLLMMSRAPTWMRDLLVARQLLAKLDYERTCEDEGADERAAALRTVLAAAYTRARSELVGRQALASFGRPIRERLEALAEEHPPDSPEELASARALVADEVVEKFVRQVRRGALVAPYWMLALLALPALPLAFLVRGPAVLRLLGVVVQTRSGRPVGRLRCLLRSTLAWSPFWLFWVFVALRAAGMTRWSPSIWITCVAAALVVGVAGAVHAVARPQASIADRLARTRLVPS